MDPRHVTYTYCGFRSEAKFAIYDCPVAKMGWVDGHSGITSLIYVSAQAQYTDQVVVDDGDAQ